MMKCNNEPPTNPVPLAVAARWLRVPAYWLRAEVNEGRLPGLQAGQSVLVHLPTVARLLAERAKVEKGGAK